MLTTIWHRLRREPLAHFLLLTALIFLAQWLFQGDQREEIVIDTATRDFLVKQEADLRLRALTDEEVDQLLETYIEEEILFREAKKRGYTSSSRVRRLLVQNMRFFLASEIGEPSEEDLRKYYDDNPEQFVSPEARTLDNVFFVDPETVPPGTLEKLNNGAVSGAVGDDTPYLEKTLFDMTERRIAGYFGPESAAMVLALDDDRWHGPIESPRGAHFLRLAKLTPRSNISFEKVKEWLPGEWQLAEQRRLTDSALQEMRKSYRIVLPEETAGD